MKILKRWTSTPNHLKKSKSRNQYLKPRVKLYHPQEKRNQVKKSIKTRLQNMTTTKKERKTSSNFTT